ncbi:NAD(P)/FAD-dependent oxidoreductase [Pseudomonas serbica]
MNSSALNSRTVVVVGAGIVGLSIALRLQLEGYEVIVIDKLEPMEGCSAGNAGYISTANIFPPATPDLIRQLPRLLLSRNGPLVIKPSYIGKMLPWSLRAVGVLKPESYTRVTGALASLITRSQDSISQLARVAKAGHLLTRDGGLHVYKNMDAFKAKQQSLSLWKEHGISAELLSGGDARAIEPALASDIIGGIYFPGAGRCSDPKELGLHYFRHLMASGATFIKSAFQGVERSGTGRLEVVHSGGRIGAMKIVLAAGYATAQMLRQYGYTNSLVSERGYHLMISRPEVRLGRPVVFGEAYFAATPMDQGLRLAGTAEFCRADTLPNMKRAYMLQRLAIQYLPGLSAKTVEPWMGVRPSLPDGVPAIGQVKGEPGLFYAFGHGHNGLTTSAITAHCVAALVDSREPPIDIGPFEYSRFG